MENRVCKNKKCLKPLPEGYKHRYCEACRNQHAQNLKNGFKAVASAAGTVACVVAIVKKVPVPGKRIKRRAAEDSLSDNKRTIQMDQLMSNLSTLQPLMRIMLIVDDSRSLTLEEKLDSAFRLPETEESCKNNMNLFNSYMRGGLEYL